MTITDAKCISRRKVYLSASGVNVTTDVVLLILPIPYVWQLHAPVAQRIVLAGLFLLGGFVTVVSIIRLSVFITLDLTSPEVTQFMSMVFIWSIVEVNVGLICACLPSLRPVLRYIGLGRLFGSTRPSRPTPGHIEPSAHSESRDKTRSSKKGGLFSTLTGGGTQWEEEEDSYQMIGQHNDHHGKTDTHIGLARTSSADTDEPHPGSLSAMPAIKVQRDWHVAVGDRPVRGD